MFFLNKYKDQTAVFLPSDKDQKVVSSNIDQEPVKYVYPSKAMIYKVCRSKQ